VRFIIYIKIFLIPIFVALFAFGQNTKVYAVNECIAVDCTRPISNPPWPTCASVVENCDPGYACPATFKGWVETFLRTSVPAECVQTSPMPNLLYRCTYAGQCQSVGAPAVPPPAPPPPGGGLPLGTCTVDAAGKVEENCGPGKFPSVSGTIPTQTCTCAEANAELLALFSIINGIMLPIVIIVGMFIIVRAGYKILTSQGNPQELQTGKENLTSAIIGLIFVLMAVSILRVIIKALITGDQDPF